MCVVFGMLSKESELSSYFLAVIPLINLAFFSCILTPSDFFKPCHVRGCRAELYPRGPTDTLPSPPAGFYIFSQCPQTLTAAGAEVWVGAHYSLAEPCQKRGEGFLKGVS